jgi:hypothetical protein
MDKNVEEHEHEATSVYMSVISNQIGQQFFKSECVRCPCPSHEKQLPCTSPVSRARHKAE